MEKEQAVRAGRSSGTRWCRCLPVSRPMGRAPGAGILSKEEVRFYPRKKYGAGPVTGERMTWGFMAHAQARLFRRWSKACCKYSSLLIRTISKPCGTASCCRGRIARPDCAGRKGTSRRCPCRPRLSPEPVTRSRPLNTTGALNRDGVEDPNNDERQHLRTPPGGGSRRRPKHGCLVEGLT